MVESITKPFTITPNREYIPNSNPKENPAPKTMARSEINTPFPSPIPKNLFSILAIISVPPVDAF